MSIALNFCVFFFLNVYVKLDLVIQPIEYQIKNKFVYIHKKNRHTFFICDRTTSVFSCIKRLRELGMETHFDEGKGGPGGSSSSLKRTQSSVKMKRQKYTVTICARDMSAGDRGKAVH